MNNIGQHQPSAEPDRDLVECAIAEVLGIAQRQGITVADFIRMLDSGMRISDFPERDERVRNCRPRHQSRFFLGQSFVGAGFQSRSCGAVFVERVLRGCYGGRQNPISDAPFNDDWIVGKTRAKTFDVLV